MLEKLGIRIVTSLIFMWYIIQMTSLQFEIDVVTFVMMLVYAVLISLIIECGYGICRHMIRYTPALIILFVLMTIGIYCWLGWGIYLGLTAYALISIGIDLYREFHMSRLLQKAMNNHL